MKQSINLLLDGCLYNSRMIRTDVLKVRGNPYTKNLRWIPNMMEPSKRCLLSNMAIFGIKNFQVPKSHPKTGSETTHVHQETGVTHSCQETIPCCTMAARTFLVMLFHQKPYHGFCELLCGYINNQVCSTASGSGSERGDFDYPGQWVPFCKYPSSLKLPRAQILCCCRSNKLQKVRKFIK